ncbi:MAG: hypothetical protein AAF921_03595 [Cyanobacteria bacterium P01_D01_bin.44]
MTTFPGSPRIAKGALISVDLFNPLSSVVIFQYNPESLSRTITPKLSKSGDRFEGPPEETISANIEINAIDQLERANDKTAAAVRLGIYPQLSALEMMVYPKSVSVLANAVLSRLGAIEIVPPKAPLTVFVWGVKRVVPVRLTSLAIEEQAYDVNLNPIRAQVSLGMTVLTYHDLSRWNRVGQGLFMAHQIAKEVMATSSSLDNISRLGELDPNAVEFAGRQASRAQDWARNTFS